MNLFMSLILKNKGVFGYAHKKGVWLFQDDQLYILH